MNKLRTVSRYFINAVLAAVLLASCSGDLECHDGVYSQDNKLLILSKKQKKDGSFWYVVKDNGTLDKGFDLYTKNNYNVGDTLEFRTLHSRQR